MTIKAEELETKVRTLVNDTESDEYRFSKEVVFDCIRRSVEHLRTINPSEKYGDDSMLDMSALAVVPDADIRINEDRHVDDVVKYAASLIYELDITDTVNMQVSETLKNRAETLMQI